ncbi:MAG: hypothetical protein NUW12_12015 [Firmicutes bacterium]|nr:hypothetical protein [Bacillota bacterium]
MVLLQELIHQLYFLMAGLVALLLIRAFFKRNTRKGLVYDIVYAYTIIPFVLRALHIK